MKCFLVCFFCKKGFDYFFIEETNCKNCGMSIVDPGIKSLVFALNLSEIATERSCEGHEGFDEGYYHAYPWITIYDDNDLEKIRLMVDNYNLMIAKLDTKLSRWKVDFNVFALKYWLFPENKHKLACSLQEESEVLAQFIISNFRKTQVISYDRHPVGL